LTSPARAARRRLDLLALALLVPAPIIGTALAMVVPGTEGTPFGAAAYVVAKVWILAIPLIWLLFVERSRLSLSPARQGGFGAGIALGVAIGIVIVAAYLLFGRGLIDPEMLRREVTDNGIGTPLRFVLFGGGLALANAVLEEYVWRWFVFRRCEALMGGAAAVFASALFFTLHHVVALRAQFGWDVTILGSAGVFVGGVVWSWLYLRYRSIWPGYVSHAIVDVAVFGVGWVIIFG
ncbi:MAG: CPBP family intramembrane glutamic endopeptidase, partial [Planctomycetota bacterium]